jgi:pimeloyl-ACP methyl ester carboxylesterase
MSSISENDFVSEKLIIDGIPTLACFHNDGRPKPLIILAHAFQSSKEFWRAKMKTLAQRGYFAVALDNRGHGERKEPDFVKQVLTPDGFNLYEVRRLIKETADDIPILVDYFTAKDQINAAHIAMIGVSMGGFTTFRALVIENRITVAVPVIASPYFDEKPEDVSLIKTPSVQKSLESYSKKFSPGHFPECFYPRALLIQLGKRDRHLSSERVAGFYRTLMSYYRETPYKLKFVVEETAGHEFTDSMWDNAVEWLNRHLM